MDSNHSARHARKGYTKVLLGFCRCMQGLLKLTAVVGVVRPPGDMPCRANQACTEPTTTYCWSPRMKEGSHGCLSEAAAAPLADAHVKALFQDDGTSSFFLEARLLPSRV